MKHIFFLFAPIFLFFSCHSDKKQESITHAEDYNNFLNTRVSKTEEEAQSLIDFWSKRLDADTTGIGEIAPLAAAYDMLFSANGTMQNLKNAETLYRKGIELSANNKDVYTRALARNYITQHRFKEADSLLQDSYNSISNKHQTTLMLFDTAMELGAYKEAYAHLNAVKNNSDYHYLIRLAKWSDYKGDLDHAIQFMEDAKAIAESRDSKPLKVWVYSNLGDFYGHAGKIDIAYQHYLKTLQLQADNHHAKKGIAWILYAGEGKTAEAHRVLDSIMNHHQLPDYYLLKSEIYSYEGDTARANLFQDKFLEAVKEGDYGAMYNTYLIEMLVDNNPEQALEIAKQEVSHRATPETYQLLAYAQLKNGSPSSALETIETHVVGKTEEPMALYYTALVYKANNKPNAVVPLQKELLASSFEIGPELSKTVALW